MITPIRPRLAWIVVALTVVAACRGSEQSSETGSETKQETQGSKVVALESGLRYEVLTNGTGRSPSATDSVTVHYRGTLTDGSEFDSSYGRGEPATFPVNRVIRGWTEALQLMKEGDKWRLTIPPQLAYGAGGVPGKIPADATLVFEVELIRVN